MASRSQSEDVSDIAADWVKKLRCRFTQLGLSSPGRSGSDYSPPHNNEGVKKSPTYYQGTEKRPYVERRKQDQDVDLTTNRDSASLPGELGKFEETSNGIFHTTNDSTNRDSASLPGELRKFEETSNGIFHTTNDSTKTISGTKSILEQEYLLEKPSVNHNGYKCRDEDLLCSNEQRKFRERFQNRVHAEDSKVRDDFSEKSETSKEFYIRPNSASSTSSCEKHDWRSNTSGVVTPELDEPSELGSSGENIELMLDWWGLKDVSKNPELSKYIPGYMKLPKNSRETVNNSDCYFNENHKDSEDDFHVFPIELDEGELARNQNGPSELYYSSSDSDYTIDDPVPKPKSPRATNGIFLGNSPRDQSFPRSLKLSHSKSPPVPQIQGSLYHNFSNESPLKHVDAVESATDNDLLTWGEMQQRPRSLSQPTITKDSFEKCDIFSYEIDDVSCDILSRKEPLAFNFKQNNFMEKDCEEVKKVEACASVDSLSEFVSMDDGFPFMPNSSDKSCKGLDVNVCFCPECGVMNRTSASWCLECGVALLNKSVEPDCKLKSSFSKGLTKSLEPKKNLVNEKSETCDWSEKSSRKNSEKCVERDGRRWETSSSAWQTYEDSHLSKPPASRNYNKSKSKKTEVTEKNGRPRSASCKNSGKKEEVRNNPTSVVGSWPKSNKTHELKSKKKNAWKSSEMRVKGDKVLDKEIPKKHDLAIDLSGLDDYGEITQMMRSSRGHPVPYLCLPDEIILHIFCHLSHVDLARCSQVCKQLKRICEDECLWKTIILKKKHNLCDEFLEKIGYKKPVRLSLIQCRGNQVTSSGLRELFRRCGDNLEELNFSGCNGGQLIGESILLHVALRCSKLQSVDASWSNVGDNGIEALVQNVERLECLCLNGCQAITDQSLKLIGDKHGESLRTFEIFGCFNVSAGGIKRLGQKCPNLQTLNLGQCYKILEREMDWQHLDYLCLSDFELTGNKLCPTYYGNDAHKRNSITSAVIGHIVSHLKSIVNLDLRGCKQARDGCVKTIAKHCPLLVNVVLANCPLITDVAITEIATNLPSVRFLDVCGCIKVTDQGVRALAKSCNRLNYLDLSSTSITKKSVMLLANYCSQNLQSLKLSFCVNVTDESVSRLVRHCKRMTTLHLYGCKRLRNMEELQKLNQSLKLEF